MTREEAIYKLESLKISLPAAKYEISEIIKLIETSWINVKDDLPCNHEELISKNCSDTKRVIVIESGGYYFDLMTLSNNGKWKWLYSFHPTHWMPIPELPKE